MRRNREAPPLWLAVLTICFYRCSLLVLVLLPFSMSAQEDRASGTPLVLSCSPEKPVAWPREVLQLRVWVLTTVSPLQYKWEATAGHINETGSETQWDFAGVQPGSYIATVHVNSGTGESSACSVRVIVLKREGERGTRETGRSFLAGNEPEAQGYGLYSYLLFGSPPDDSSRERYLKAIEAYLQLIPTVIELEKYLPLTELNVTYLPIRETTPKTVSAKWVLEHYNYGRARVLLKTLPGTYRDGPYIVSLLKPLSGIQSLSGQYLYQNLSSVPPDLVSAWEKEFLNQAAQERFWEGRSAENLVLRLRTTIGVLAIGLPEVRKSLDQWVAWKQ
jgi:hypothetical protein